MPTSNSETHTTALTWLSGGVICVFAILSACLFYSSRDRASSYDPTKVFGLQFRLPTASPERTAGGSPGQAYWTNRADYIIKIRLDTSSDTLAGTAEIHYTNNSPDTLPYLWLQLYQNIYRAGSLAELTTPYGNRFGARITDGMLISGVYLVEKGTRTELSYRIDDSSMRVEIPRGLAAHGGSVNLSIDYSFKMSSTFQGPRERMGISSSNEGPIYAVAHWYPRMLVYDDLHGWNAEPYRAVGEFYLDYGDYDVSIDVPWNYLVAAPGDLLNPSSVLSQQELARLRQAASGDKTIQVVGPAEVGHRDPGLAGSGRLVWHYALKDARDFAWGTSAAFVWDAAGVDLLSHGHAVTMAFYPKELSGDGWSDAAQYLRQNLQFMSSEFLEYPYPTAVAMTADVAGMEYPGMVFLTANKSGEKYRMRRYITHEIGHTLFPMVVGSDEHRYAWMDEGLDTFENWLAINTFNGQKPATALDAQVAIQVVNIMQNQQLPIMSAADDIPEDQYYPIEYVETAYGMALLREYVLDDTAVFDAAFKDYIHAWAYRHPAPEDFFRLMNNETGRNLDWFWNEWFFHNWKLDQAVNGVAYAGDPGRGSLITLSNRQQMAMPVVMEVTECNGQKRRIKLPVEIWSQGDTWTVAVATHTKLKSVILDPDGLLPDSDRSNNSWNGRCWLN